MLYNFFDGLVLDGGRQDYTIRFFLFFFAVVNDATHHVLVFCLLLRTRVSPFLRDRHHVRIEIHTIWMAKQQSRLKIFG